jgi:hypothetical protein
MSRGNLYSRASSISPVSRSFGVRLAQLQLLWQLRLSRWSRFSAEIVLEKCLLKQLSWWSRFPAEIVLGKRLLKQLLNVDERVKCS